MEIKLIDELTVCAIICIFGRFDCILGVKNN